MFDSLNGWWFRCAELSRDNKYLVAVDLQACRNFDNDNLCENFCPPEYVYSPTLFRQVPNPDAKYAYGSLCVDKCPCKLFMYMQIMPFGLTNCGFKTNVYLHVLV